MLHCIYRMVEYSEESYTKAVERNKEVSIPEQSEKVLLEEGYDNAKCGW